MNEIGFIKLHRKILNWEWYKDIPTKTLFLHLLLNANIKPTKYRGYDIPKGGMVVGRKELAIQTGLSEQQVRTSLDKLKLTKEITTKSTNFFTIISICCWNKFQDVNQRITNEQPTDNQQITTEKEVKKERKKEYINDFWQPDENTLKKIKSKGYQEEQINKVRESFINTIIATNNKYKYKDFNRAFLNWVIKEEPKIEKSEFDKYL